MLGSQKQSTKPVFESLPPRPQRSAQTWLSSTWSEITQLPASGLRCHPLPPTKAVFPKRLRTMENSSSLAQTLLPGYLGVWCWKCFKGLGLSKKIFPRTWEFSLTLHSLWSCQKDWGEFPPRNHSCIAIWPFPFLTDSQASAFPHLDFFTIPLAAAQCRSPVTHSTLTSPHGPLCSAVS